MKWIFTLLIITPCLLYSQSANDSIKSHDIYEIGIDKLISKYESIIKNKKGQKDGEFSWASIQNNKK